MSTSNSEMDHDENGWFDNYLYFIISHSQPPLGAWGSPKDGGAHV